MPESTTITLGKEAIKVFPPASMSTRWKILEAVGKDNSMGLCAALGVAWGGPPLKVKAVRFGYDYLLYGAAVMDELAAKYKVTARQILAAGAQALNAYPTDDLISEEEVADKESFTEGPADSIT